MSAHIDAGTIGYRFIERFDRRVTSVDAWAGMCIEPAAAVDDANAVDTLDGESLGAQTDHFMICAARDINGVHSAETQIGLAKQAAVTNTKAFFSLLILTP